jgi:hypothetical protein
MRSAGIWRRRRSYEGIVNTLSFTASVIGSLAWPVTLLIFLVILLKNGPKLSRFVKSIRFKEFELTLRDDLEKAKNIAETIQVTLIASEDSKERAASEDKVLALAQIDPGVAILKSWQKLEQKLTQLIQHNGLIRFTSNREFVQRLLQLNKITEADVALFDKLRSIRNTVVHAHNDKRSMSVAEVVEYGPRVASRNFVTGCLINDVTGSSAACR